MNKSIKTFWGIALTVVMLVSMLVVAVPASANALSFSASGMPNPAPGGVPSNQVSNGSDVNIVKVAPNGDIFAVDNHATPSVIWKSTNGGQTWTANSVALPAGDTVADLAISPSYATDSTVAVVVNGNNKVDVLLSTNGGASFVQLGGDITTTANMVGTSIDFQPTYSAGSGMIMVSTADSAANAAAGDVYLWGQNGTLNWIGQLTANPATPTVTATVTTTFVDGGDGLPESYNVTYTNQAGTANHIGTLSIPVNAAAGTTATLTLQAGDTGVESVSAVAKVVSDATGIFTLTGTAGTLLATYNTGTAAFTVGTAVGYDVAQARFSPSYPLDATIFAVTATAGGTYLQSQIVGQAWNSIAGYPAKLGTQTGMGDGTGLVSASMAFPSDFNASIPASRNVFVGLNGKVANVGNDVWRVTSTATATTGTNLSMNAAAATTNGGYSLAYMGTYASGTLYVGVANGNNVYYSANAGTANAALVTFSQTVKAPTGPTTGHAVGTVVAYSGNNIYAGTANNAAGQTDDESAFSVSYDGGADFYQIGLIDTTISSISGQVFATPTTWFMVTKNAAVNNASLWKSTDAGSTWLRVGYMTLAIAGDNAAVAVSPNFATDNTVYFYETGTNAATLQMSQDGGNTWTPRAFPAGIGNVGSIVPVDQYNMYVTDFANNNVYKSVNNGWTYTTETIGAAVTGVNQLVIDSGTGDLLAGMASGTVFLSTDGGTTWTQQGTAAVGGGAASVAFSNNFATDNDIYAGITAAGGSVWRWTVGTSTAWYDLDTVTGAIPAAAGGVTAVYVSDNGVLYATVANANGGLYRAIAPTTGSTVYAMATPGQLINTGLTAGYTLSDLYYLAGSVYSIDTTNGPTVEVYGDALAASVPTVTAPAANAVIQNTAITVTIEPVTGDPGTDGYYVQWNTRNDFLGTGGTQQIAAYPSYSATLGSTATTPRADVILGGNVPAVPTGVPIYYRVRVSTPIWGPWSQTYTVNTQLAPATAPNAPVINIPASPEGSTAQGGFNVDPNASFFWGAVTGATNYEFQLATDPAFTNLVVDDSGANALGNVQAYTVTSPLNYSTTYYWRVRATSATSSTSWSDVQAFRVMAQPTTAAATSTGSAAAPTITVTQPPATTVTFTQTQPPATTITIPPAQPAQQVGPAYIWVIIIIGAILVIAVIVLIVRTRRSV